MNRPEQALQRAICDLLAVALAPGAVFFAIPNGGRRSPTEAAIMRGTGTVAGIPDLAIVHEGRVFFAELKAARGRLSAAQSAMHARLRAAGCPVAIWRTMEDALADLAAWQVPLRLVAARPR